MKMLIVLLALLFGVWLWRRGRKMRQPNPGRTRRAGAERMVECARCGVHLPTSTAVHGRSGEYCCDAHRREAEGG